MQEFKMSKSVARKHIKAAKELEDNPEAANTIFRALRQGYLNVDTINKIIQECDGLAPEASDSRARILQSACKQSGMLGNSGTLRETRRLVRKANSQFPTNPNLAFQNRKLSIGRQDSNGGARITGYLDAATLALLDACITSFIRKKNDSNGKKPTDQEVEAPQSDDKNFAQYSVDAIRETLKARAHDKDKAGNNAACTIVAIATSKDLQTIASSAANSATQFDQDTRNVEFTRQADVKRLSNETQSIHPTRLRFQTTSGLDLGITDLLRLGLTSETYGAFFDPNVPLTEQSLRLGRGKRSATFAQRLALALFDGCCQYPGCDMPMSKCDVHHIEAWALGGTTDLENLTLMCRYHHSLNDDSHNAPHRGHMSQRQEENMWKCGWVPPTNPSSTNSGEGKDEPIIEFNHSYAASHAPLAALRFPQQAREPNMHESIHNQPQRAYKTAQTTC